MASNSRIRTNPARLKESRNDTGSIENAESDKKVFVLRDSDEDVCTILDGTPAIEDEDHFIEHKEDVDCDSDITAKEKQEERSLLGLSKFFKRKRTDLNLRPTQRRRTDAASEKYQAVVETSRWMKRVQTQPGGFSFRDDYKM